MIPSELQKIEMMMDRKIIEMQKDKKATTETFGNAVIEDHTLKTIKAVKFSCVEN